MRVLTVTGAHALRLWSDLRASINITKLWPVIIGEKEALRDLEERLSPNYFEEDITTEKILAASTAIDPLMWFGARPEDNSYYQIEKGVWDDNTQPNNLFKVHLDTLHGRPHDAVYIVLVPTINPWEIPAYLRFGYGNDNPDPEQHVAVLKHWNIQYGAEIVSLKSDFLELNVLHPPKSKKTSMELAREQFIYCPDLAQGLGSLSALGSLLYQSKAWNFWWD